MNELSCHWVACQVADARWVGAGASRRLHEMPFDGDRLDTYRLAVSRFPSTMALGAVVLLACTNGHRDAVEPQVTPAATTSSAEPARRISDTDSVDLRSAPPASSEAAHDEPARSDPSNPTPSKTDARTEPVPPLREASGDPLPQTEELPSFDSPSFKRRMELLFEAIVRDDPSLAAPAFFPLVAYEQVKAISNPGRDLKLRLHAAFARNIHDYHRQLGAGASSAKLLGLEPSTLAPRWMKPGTEGNRLGYYRVLRCRLRVEDPRGSERKLEITSMISWRGEWYVVHLNGFK